MSDVDPYPDMDLDPIVDLDPTWIRIHAIPIPALLGAIPAPDLDPQKSGIITPLVWHYLIPLIVGVTGILF